MCAIYFCVVMGHYGLTFWMPALIQSAGVTGTFRIGMFTAIPYTGGAIAMVLVGSARGQDARAAPARGWCRWSSARSALSLSAIAGTHTARGNACS